MKNIIKIIKSITLNKRGSATQNVLKGLGIAVFASVTLYGVYTAYNNSPAYNPERRALFVADNQNLSANSFGEDNFTLKTLDGVPEGMRSEYGEFGKVSKDGSLKNTINRNEEDFANARAYLDAQKAGSAGAHANLNGGQNVRFEQPGQELQTAEQFAQSEQLAQSAQSSQYSAQPVQSVEPSAQTAQSLQEAKSGAVQSGSKDQIAKAIGSGAEGSSVVANLGKGQDQVAETKTPMLTAKGGVKSSYNKKGYNSYDDVEVAGVVGASGSANAAGSINKGAAVGQSVSVQGEGAQSAAAKSNKEEESSADEKQGVRNSTAKKSGTVINKLTTSGGSSFMTGAAGGSSSVGGGFSASSGGSKANKDTSAQPLSSLNLADAKSNTNTFKTGRGGTMGGYNVASNTGGKAENTRGGGGDKGAKADLNRSYLVSRGAGKKVYKPGTKSSAAYDAASAFDGSENATGGDIGGDKVNTSDSRIFTYGLSYHDLDNSFSKFRDTTISDDERQTNLEGSALTHFLKALLTTIAAMYTLAILKKMANGPQAWAVWIAIAAVALAAIYAIWFMDYDGDGKNIWEDMGELWDLNKKLGNKQGGSWSLWLRPILGIFTLGIGASIIWGTSIANKFSKFSESWIGKRVGNLASTKVLADAKNSIGSLSSKL